jgi:hypothetical protein
MLVTCVTNSGADLSASGIGRLLTVCEPPLTDAQNNAFFFNCLANFPLNSVLPLAADVPGTSSWLSSFPKSHFEEPFRDPHNPRTPALESSLL